MKKGDAKEEVKPKAAATPAKPTPAPARSEASTYTPPKRFPESSAGSFSSVGGQGQRLGGSGANTGSQIGMGQPDAGGNRPERNAWQEGPISQSNIRLMNPLSV